VSERAPFATIEPVLAQVERLAAEAFVREDWESCERWADVAFSIRDALRRHCHVHRAGGPWEEVRG
jgi:hypothetical protein